MPLFLRLLASAGSLSRNDIQELTRPKVSFGNETFFQDIYSFFSIEFCSYVVRAFFQDKSWPDILGQIFDRYSTRSNRKMAQNKSLNVSDVC